MNPLVKTSMRYPYYPSPVPGASNSWEAKGMISYLHNIESLSIIELNIYYISDQLPGAHFLFGGELL